MAEEDPLTVLYNYDASLAKEKSKPKQKKEADNFPDYPEPTPKKVSRPRKKQVEPDPEPEAPVFKPRVDLLTAVAAVILLIGVAAAIITSCI